MSATAAASAWLEERPADRTVLVLMRHGEVENPGRIRYGRLPGYPLSARGRVQAAEAAVRLLPLAKALRVIRTSPLERTRETAAILAEHLSAPMLVDEALLEATSRFDGLTRGQIFDPRHLRAAWNPLTPSWAESFRAVGDRMRAAILHAEADARGGAAILVGHQSPLWLGVLALEDGGPGLGAALRRAIPPWLRRPVRPAPASLVVLRFEEGRLADTRN